MYSEFESTVLQPRGDHVPPSSVESQNTQVWFDSFVCEHNQHTMTESTPAEKEILAANSTLPSSSVGKLIGLAP